MVEDRITDGKRIAQILASELSGRDDGPLGNVNVVDADRDAEPSVEGTVAYDISVDGERVGDVVLYPESVEIVVRELDSEAIIDGVREPGLTGRVEDGTAIVTIEYGAAVKRAVDALVAGVDR